MDKYQGINDDDKPVNGGSYVEDTKNAHETCNFLPICFTDDDSEGDSEYCLGFFETKSTNGSTRNQLHMVLGKLMFGLAMKKIIRLKKII